MARNIFNTRPCFTTAPLPRLTAGLFFDVITTRVRCGGFDALECLFSPKFLSGNQQPANILGYLLRVTRTLFKNCKFAHNTTSPLEGWLGCERWTDDTGSIDQLPPFDSQHDNICGQQKDVFPVRLEVGELITFEFSAQSLLAYARCAGSSCQP